MIAILSDIHGNLEALSAVLADVASQGVSTIYCLGDVVGYGPDPRACLDLAQQWKLVLLGNHEYAVLYDSPTLNPSAKRAVDWTRRELQEPIPHSDSVERRWGFLAALSPVWREDDMLFVHGSPRRPLDEYVFPWIVGDEPAAAALFQLVSRICFVGHTHIPGVLTDPHTFLSPEAMNEIFIVDESKAIVNVGSVGQPRDRDWCASYALFDGKTVLFRRIEYDLETTIKKMQAVAELRGVLANRLREGR